MDTHTLINNLRDMPATDFEWTFSFYTSKKSRDGIELDISQCEMQDIVGLANSCIEYLLQKVMPDRVVAEYSPLLPREVVGAIEQSNELIRDQVRDIIIGLQSSFTYAPEDYVSGAAATPTGYIISGCKRNENGEIAEQVLFMKRSNPFIRGGKSRLCMSSDGKISATETPILKFTQTTDLLLLDNLCYILSPSIEKDLGLESRQIAITTKRMSVIAEKAIVNNYDELEKAAYSAKNARKFLDFDREVLDHIVRLPILERTDFLSEYGLATDNEGLIDTYDAEQCELLIDLICGRSCHDALGRLSIGSNIMPRQ